MTAPGRHPISGVTLLAAGLVTTIVLWIAWRSP